MLTTPRFYTWKEIEVMTTLSRQTIERMQQPDENDDYEFPLDVELSINRRGFFAEQVDLWMKDPAAWKEQIRRQNRDKRNPGGE